MVDVHVGVRRGDDSGTMSNMTGDPRALRATMYGEADLSRLPVFSGDFINYGCWDGIDVDRPLTVADRTRSQAQLYRATVDALPDPAGATVAEIGCGIGVGTDLVAREYHPAVLVAIDSSAAQLDRARQRGGPPSPRRRLVRGSATALPVRPGSVDAVYSVEMAQHIDDLPALGRELSAVLRPGGWAAVTTFFAPAAADDAALGTLLPTVSDGIDRIHPVGRMVAALAGAGLTDITAVSIGDRVWPGLDAWIAGTELRDSWARNWHTAWRQGLLDYCLITAIKP